MFYKFVKLITIGVLLIVVSCVEKKEQKFSIAELGKPAPDFALKDINGNIVHLKELKRKVIIIEFWATWCHACKQTASALERLYERYKDRGLQVLGITIDRGFGAKNNVIQFVKTNGQQYPILWDDGQTSKVYRVIRIPITYVLDERYIIKEIIVGYAKSYEEKLNNIIKELL